MKLRNLIITALLIVNFHFSFFNSQAQTYPIQKIDLRNVHLTDNFWLPKIRQIQQVTIPVAFERCEKEGRFENFLAAEKVMNGGTGKVRGKMPFDDTDVYKIIEGASLSLVSAPDSKLEAQLDKYIAIVARGQEPDGYLTTWRTINPAEPSAKWVGKCEKRWDNLAMSHELYNAGHLFEAAAAHFYATGKRNFLNIALKNADLIVNVFGAPDNYDVPGHEIIETGLIKLYLITGKKAYFDLAKKFVDLRGTSEHRKPRGEYWQDDKPVLQHDEVVGHAVRAVYFYAGVTDVAAITNKADYKNTVQRLWNNMVNRKMYVTGGLGARHSGEAFGQNYELPNLTAYNETCAAIGGVMWADRMFQLFGEADYYNILERMLYNAVLPGISLDGTCFFYPNPLESDGVYKFNQEHLTRAGWFDCSCCPTNLIRFLPSIPNLIYNIDNQHIVVNLFIGSEAKIPFEKNIVNILQTTNYPLDGKVNIAVNPKKSAKFTLKIRIPDWATDRFPSELYAYENVVSTQIKLLLNGKEIELNENNGYIEINRKWKKGDKVEISFPMEVRKIAANQLIKDDKGKTALQYGALVYCMEGIDNKDIFDKDLDADNFNIKYNQTKLGGINEIFTTNGLHTWDFIPYYTWSNRGEGKMKVWTKSGFRSYATTPPMGWNSWDCYGPTVEEHEVKANADYMAEKLKKYGWEYIVVDIRWFVENDKAGGYNQTDPRYVMDEFGRYQPAVNRFPSAANGAGFKPLADYVHSKGLKFGIHIMRGIPKVAVERKLKIKGTDITADQIYSTELQCKWLCDNYTIKDVPGGQEYYNSIIELYALWGVDFIKVDDLSKPYHKAEIEMIRKAIDRCGRPIVLSTSPGETPVSEAQHVSTHANMWRMVDDIWDTWGHLTHLMKVAQGWYSYISPTFPDCDMIPLGRISIRGERGQDRMTRLTKDEQYSLMTFFTIFRSPLMFGGDLPSNDEFTLSLLTNEEVLKMHREGSEVRQIFQKDGQVAVTSRNAKNGDVYLALFNLKDTESQDVSVSLSDLGLSGKYDIFDMWNDKDLGIFETAFSTNLKPHSCILVKINKERNNL